MTPAMARRLELWPLERLVPYARNERTHSAEQVAQIAASIAEFEFVNPILVDSRDGVVAGHGRLLAARKLGLAEVPVIVLDHLTETQRRAYVLADNRLALNAGWDDEVLAAELAALEADGFVLDMLGFSEREFADLMAGPEEAPAAEAEEDVPLPPAKAVTQPGDLWLIGAAPAAAKLFERQHANVVVTSPPYAAQREYDPASGMQPVAPEDYVEWRCAVAASMSSMLAGERERPPGGDQGRGLHPVLGGSAPRRRLVEEGGRETLCAVVSHRTTRRRPSPHRPVPGTDSRPTVAGERPGGPSAHPPAFGRRNLIGRRYLPGLRHGRAHDAPAPRISRLPNPTG